jgi:hypothetical protein
MRGQYTPDSSCTTDQVMVGGICKRDGMPFPLSRDARPMCIGGTCCLSREYETGQGGLEPDERLMLSASDTEERCELRDTSALVQRGRHWIVGLEMDRHLVGNGRDCVNPMGLAWWPRKKEKAIFSQTNLGTWPHFMPAAYMQCTCPGRLASHIHSDARGGAMGRLRCCLGQANMNRRRSHAQCASGDGCECPCSRRSAPIVEGAHCCNVGIGSLSFGSPCCWRRMAGRGTGDMPQGKERTSALS